MPRSIFSRAARQLGAGFAADGSLGDVVRALAIRFGVSRQAAAIRLKTLKIVREDHVELDLF